MLTYVDTGLLILRLVVGLVFVGHGAQKLFGWFGGPGMKGHIGFMEKLDVHPARFWAWVSALGEFFGGLGLALGLLTPLAATAIIGAMLVAMIRVNWPNGFWNTNRGFEWPLVLATVAFVVGLTGPGFYSLDYAFGLGLPEPLVYIVALLAMLVTVAGAVIPPLLTRKQEPESG
jgi:putative oxidoreductase